ncbi:MAG: hypothetical protein DKINENOH_00026 [bacterium]|nr:hypothetical protein [bacterium]
MLIDTHAHLQLEQFAGDREAVIQHTQQAGVEKIIVVSTDLAFSRQSLALLGKHSGLFAAVHCRSTYSNFCLREAILFSLTPTWYVLTCLPASRLNQQVG